MKINNIWSGRSVGTKLALMTIGIVAIALAILIGVATHRASEALDDAAQSELRGRISQIAKTISVYDQSLKASTDRMAALLLAMNPEPITIDPRRRVRIGEIEVPTLLSGSIPLNLDNERLDRFAKMTGNEATLFVRNGDDFVRIATTLKDQNNARAVGTRLATESLAYAAALRGESYLGYAKVLGTDFMTKYLPIKDANGAVIGLWFCGVNVSESMKALRDSILAEKVGDSGYVFVLDSAAGPNFGNFVVHPTRVGANGLGIKDSVTGREFVKDLLSTKQGVIYYQFTDTTRGDTKPQDKLVVFDHYANWNWVIAGTTFLSEVNRPSAELRVWLAGVGVGTLVALGLAIGWAIRRMIRIPLTRVVEVAQTVAKGDLSCTIVAQSQDEIGQLQVAMADMADRLRGVIGQIREATEAVTTASGQIAAGNADLSQRTEEQASSLEETASSMEELTSTVKQNADNAKQANQLAAGASEVASKGGAVVGEVVTTMSAISESSKKIADIISVIDGIAFQTNILALNAAVEAARAGEQGRGFAVVASEVRSLAQRSAAAAKEIKDLITDSVTKVDAGYALVEAAGRTMTEVVTSVRKVTDIMAEITAASLEQSSGIEQVNQAIIQMDQVTQQNAALVEESAAAAESMEEQAKQLAAAVAVFKVHGDNATAPARAVIAKVQATAKAAVGTASAANARSRGRIAATDALTKTPRLVKPKAPADDEWAEF